MRVLLVDDHPVFLEGIAALAGLEGDLEVVGKASALQDARRLVATMRPDVVVADLTLDGDSGLDLIRWLRGNGNVVPVLVATMHEDPIYIDRAIEVGATSFVTKRVAAAEIITAIRRTGGGESVILSNHAAARPAAEGTRQDPVISLSAREFEIFERIGQGLGTAKIAELLHRSVKTVESHRSSIMKKLGLSKAAELVRYATLWVKRD